MIDRRWLRKYTEKTIIIYNYQDIAVSEKREL